MNSLYLLLTVVIVVPVFMIVMIYFVATQSADIQFTPYDPYVAPPPSDIWEYICRRYAEVQPLGFQVVAYLFQSGQVKGFTTSVTLLKSSQTGDHGSIVSIFGSSTGITSVRKSYFEFTTEFENGVEVNTNNSQTLLGTFAHPETKFAFQFPKIEYAAELFKIHAYLCWKHGGGVSKVLSPDGQEIEALTRSCYKDLNYQVESGLMRLSGGRFRPTIWGAVMMTWKNVWPIVAIRRSRSAAQSRRILEEMRNRA